MLRLHPSTIDYVILAIYFVVVLGIGFVARLAIKTDVDFFLSAARCRRGSRASPLSPPT